MSAFVAQLLLGYVFALLPAPALFAQSSTQFAVRADAAPCLKVRTGPKSTAQSFACLVPGTQVQSTGVAPYWRRVRLADGRTGWAAKRFLDLVESPGTPADTGREDAWLEIHVVDVGQGDGIWIHTFDDNIPGNGRYEGKNIVIDGGPNASEATNELLKYVLSRAHNGAMIDALVVTHPHDDHYPGAEGILRRFDVREYYDSGYPKDGTKWAGFRALVTAEQAQGRAIVQRRGRDSLGTPDWGSELRVRFLHAYAGNGDGLGSGNTLENNASIVFKLEYGSQSVLFMGDAEGKDRADGPDTPRYVERRLLESLGPAALKSTVLKIGHHGSETSSTLPFIAAVDPDYVVVSSGRKSFGGVFLPDASTLRRYCERKPSTRIYRTDQDDVVEGRTAANDGDGDHVIIRTNGRVTTVEGFSAGNRITHTACIT